jgi:hypothetical protein
MRLYVCTYVSSLYRHLPASVISLLTLVPFISISLINEEVGLENIWIAFCFKIWTLISGIKKCFRRKYIHHHHHHHHHHLWSRAILEKPPIVLLLKNLPAFYATRRFITVFTRDLHRSISWARSVQSIPSYHISLRSILILSTHLRLGLPSGIIPTLF